MPAVPHLVLFLPLGQPLPEELQQAIAGGVGSCSSDGNEKHTPDPARQMLKGNQHKPNSEPKTSGQ